MTLDYFYGQAGELFSFYRIPKALFQEQRFQDLSTDAKTLYGILLDRMSLSVKNGWLDEQNRVFIIFTIEDVKRALCCADNKATKLLRELEKFGLIERKRRGLGKPSLVYVKNFSSESSKESVKNRDNDDSCGSKIACQDPAKSRGIKNKENKTEMNNTNPILSDESEKMKNRELLEEYFSYSLEIDLLLRLSPDDEDTLYQIVNLLVDTCATNRKLLHIAGDDKPAEVVRSRMKKLNADHIRFVLDSLAENTAPVRNMKQYLLASLYANYSEEDNPLSLKADFILSLCELVVGGKEGLLPVEKTVIDRCVHQLSTIEYKPYRERQKRIVYPPKESNRDRLCGIIDTILAEKPGDYETFLQKLEQQGYEVKRGKYTSVKGKGQKRFIRFRTLGTGYGEDEIKAVLEGKAEHLPHQKQPPKEQPFQLLVDIQGKMAAGKSVGYKKWATKFNLKEMSKTLLFLQEQKISSADELR